MKSYVGHIRANNPRGAYQLLTKKIRTVLSYEAFERKWKRNYRELKAQADAIEKRLGKPKQYSVRAKLKLGARRQAALTWEEGGWHILGGVGSGFDALTPKEAVLALVRSLETKNFSAFLKLLSKDKREKFLRAYRSRLEKLKANLDREFEISGNRARLQYDPQFWIVLVKENGVWKIVEFN